VTDGPYAESAEQLSGFYLVTCEDEDGLGEAAKALVRAHPAVEIRLVEGRAEDPDDPCRFRRLSRVIGKRGTLSPTTREDSHDQLRRTPAR
jgi:hypothetical protein